MTKSDEVILKVENLSKQYRLGLVGTGTLSHDLNRWWHRVRGKEDPYLKIGETNDRSQKGESEYVWALKDINFEVKRGEVLGIIGKNGAGKSTLLKILSKVTSPTTGSVKTRGRIASLLEVGTGFHGEMTGRENIYLNGAILGMTKKEIASKIDEIIDFSGCARYIDTPVKRYSSGMTVRLAFAVAAFLEPDILIVDEVLAVGDAEFQKKAIGKMQDISSGEGRTVLFVSHNMQAVKRLCTRALIIQDSRISLNSDPENCIRHYLSENLDLGPNFDGRFDLSTSKNKNISYGLKSAILKCNGHITNIITAGALLSVELHFDLPFKLNDAEIGFKISDSENRSFIGLNNLHLGRKIDIPEGKGIAIIEIEDFPFYSKANYWLSLYLGNDNDFYECLENEIQIQTQPNISSAQIRKLDSKYNLIRHSKIYIALT